MRVLVLGSGGREHTIAWKLLQSPKVKTLVMCPENSAAIEQLRREYSKKEINAWDDSVKGSDSLKSLATKAKAQKIDFVVVGPDNVLADGAVDIFTREGLKIFGPTQAAAKLESSKIFAKQVMKAAKVPTADSYEVYSLADAQKLVNDLNWVRKQWVLKADGLALGKGVEICENREQALAGLARLQKFSNSFVIEERLRGKEISWLAFCDGDNCSLLAPARDYKTLTPDPLSPNTGGMGAVCPVPLEDSKLGDKIRDTVFAPVLREMKKRGTPYKGILYAGLMIDGEDFWVLEFNSRFGDPEAQVLLPLVQDDVLEWCEACVEGKLHLKPRTLPVFDEYAVYVVAAAPGYPGEVQSGGKITGLDQWLKTHSGFFAGVRREGDQWLTNGGRVLGALGFGNSIAEAREKAYARLQQVHFDGMQVRQDVGAEWA